MKKVLIVYDSRTGRTRLMADHIAKGVADAGADAIVKPIGEIDSESDLDGYDAYLFGCPTYFRDMTDEMKTFLFMAKNAGLKGKIGGSFGSYTHLGDAPKLIHDTLAHVYGMETADMGSLNVKEQILDADKGEEPCRAYGKGIGEALSG